jgi:catechol 2,3-dioxygenase-like lactoylglutathione lyase family enzyme
MRINQTHVILYVSNQSQSKDFYAALLGYEPLYSVPGMTEFWLTGNTKLGLMSKMVLLKLLL